MSAIFNKAGQAHRCSARAGSTAVNALGKRATRATGRRKATFSEIFTACYSSMFATAAVVDAFRKEERRNELDRQLEETRRELAELKAADTSSRADLDLEPAKLTIDQMDILWTSLKEIWHNRPYMKEIHHPADHSISELVTKLKQEHYGCPDRATLRAMLEMDYSRLEKEITTEQNSSLQTQRLPRTELQLHRDTESIEHLVQQLIFRAYYAKGAKETRLRKTLVKVQEWKERGFPHYRYAIDDPTSARLNTIALNQRIKAVLESDRYSMQSRVRKICYNLLISEYPPDIHTQNTLIVAFDKAGQHALAEAVVNSFFNCRLLKPTPSTFVAILNHYKYTNNHLHFMRTVASLTGAEGKKGAKLGRRHVDLIPATPFGQSWASDTRRRTLTENYVWEHAPLSQAINEAVLNGLLYFKLFDQAASYLISCVRAGARLSTSNVRAVFDHCLTALDWRAAIRLVRSLSSCHDLWPKLIQSLDEDSKTYIVHKIYHLLDLCGMDETTSRSTGSGSDLVLTEEERTRVYGALGQLFAHTSKLQSTSMASSIALDESAISRSRLLRIESLYREYVLVRKTTASIESKLLQDPFAMDFRQSMLEHVASSAVSRSRKLSSEVEALTSRMIEDDDTRSQERSSKALTAKTSTRLLGLDTPKI